MPPLLPFTTSPDPSSAPSTSPSPTFPPEVYAHIISFLRRPPPPPNGRNTRSSIRQPDLAVMMRCSKLLNDLTSLPLYTTVVTDDLERFTYNLGAPRVGSGIRSKAQLVGCVRKLYLEHAARLEPSYSGIMQTGQDAFDIICPDRLVEATLCKVHASSIQDGANLLKPHVNLCSISLSIFLGPSPYDWQSLIQNSPIPELEALVFNASMALSNLSADPHPSHLCDRGQRGPLVFQPLLLSSQSPTAKQQRHATHVDIDTTLSQIPARPGAHSDFYFSFDRHGDPGFDEGIKMVLILAGWQMKAREYMRGVKSQMEGEDLKAERLDSESLSLTFYVPAYWLEAGRGRDIHLEVARVVKESRVQYSVPHSSYPSDSFLLKKIEEARPCGACLWSPDDIK